jgi:benzoylformate decarboxylase
MSEHDRSAVQARGAAHANRHREVAQRLRDAITARRAIRPMHPSVLMESLARVLPPDVAVVEEAVTTTNTTFQRLGAIKNTSGYFAHRGWALGWGLGCSLGVKLAWPERPVLAVLGEGAAMYGIQGLWTAAHYKLGVTFVIPNNAQYQILKAGAANLGLPAAQSGQFVGMDLAGPEVDMVGLARSFGIHAERVEEPEELSEKVAASLAAGTPHLFNVPIERSLAGPG